MTAKIIHIWCTKYALSQGITEFDAELSNASPNMIRVGYTCFHGEGREWHRTKEAAAEKAGLMRLARIASLKKQIQKLEQMVFE